MMQPGRYKARAFDAELTQTRTGKEQIAVHFRISEGAHQGEMIAWYGYTNTPASAKRTFEALRACGWAGQDLSNLEGLDSQEVELVLAQEEYEGRRRIQVRWVNSLARRGGRPMTEAEKKAFAARMKGLLLTLNPPAPVSDPGPDPWDILPQVEQGKDKLS